MKKENSIEEQIIEFLKVLGYRYLETSTVESLRVTQHSCILIKLLQKSLLRLNPWLSDDSLNQAISAITRINATNLIEANELIYYTITHGTTVLQKLNSGTVNQSIKYIDFDNPNNNDYVVTRQFKIQVAQEYFILDIVVFINGLPLAIFECKSPSINNSITECVEQLLRYQKIEEKGQVGSISSVFSIAQILIASCSEQAVFGSISNPSYRYATFPVPYPMTSARFTRFLNRQPNAQDILIYSLLEPSNLLEYIRNFIVFEVNTGHKLKILARYHQRIAVDQAVQRILSNNTPTERGGIICHSQGSGKTLTIALLVQKLRQESLKLNNPTIVIVTDRIDLDNQIADFFRRVNLSNFRRAESIQHLGELLNKGQGITILTTLQKFYDGGRISKSINPSSNVIVIVDEAHRNQYGAMAASMREALPQAIFIAFTGTPIDIRDRSTLLLFGNYIHKYSIQESVQDKVTVPIFYEHRNTEQFGFREYDFREEELVQHKSITLESIATGIERISKIALDLVQHFEQTIRPNGFKGQIVTYNRLAAVRYKAELDKLNAPESAVIFTSSRNDNEEIAAYYTTSAERKKLITRFQNPEDPLRLLIVVDMLLAGFDAPIEQVIYLDAPLKGHTLLQAIARVNRPYPGKNSGLIVDYWGVYQHLHDALIMFDTQELNEMIQEKDSELSILKVHHRSVMRLFDNISLDDYDVLLQVIQAEDERAKFDQAFKAFAQSLDLMYPDSSVLPFVDDFKQLGKIRELARSHFQDYSLDWNDIPFKVRCLIEDVKPIIAPISIFSAEFNKELECLRSDEVKISKIAHAINYFIQIHASENPVFYNSIKERLEKILQDSQQNSLFYSEQLRQIIDLKEELYSGISNASKQLGLYETTYAFYLLLEQNGIEQALTIDVAKEIESTLQSLIVVDWVNKEDVQREMRKHLRRLLIGQGIKRDAIEPLIYQLMEAARANLI
ncbi:type I restriction endonuclease subunit R [Nostoc sp. XA010]|uniref:type I restriction endonuclease subunit R n=1 Tax=Nostoc sp. XA010 TaxID=2780407 RepID=UPI001E3BBA09|nr:type I restriction endonuclease subunit R [Nostoc sp. XA010]MCC5661448.1 type I restriction endonuclease subunit R [Nostoc sp. XA010]